MAWQMSTTPVLSSWIITFHQTGIHSSLIQTGQTMLLMCFFIFYSRKERWMTPNKSSRLFHIYWYIHILEKNYLKSFITGITDVSCRFSLSQKKDGPLQKTSWKLTVVVTMATVTNSLICNPFFLPKDLHSKSRLCFRTIWKCEYILSYVSYTGHWTSAKEWLITSSAASAKGTQTRLYSVDSSQCNFCFSSFVNDLWYCLILCQKSL